MNWKAELTRIIIGSGGQHAFQPIIASGKSACTLHYVSNDSVLRPGTLTLLDFGAKYAYMNADMSRTIPVSGRFTRQQKVIYLEVLSMLNKVTDLMRPGITLAELNKETGKDDGCSPDSTKLLARNDIRKQDPSRPLAEKIFHAWRQSSPRDWNVHDQYEKDAPLKSGMVLTCEPGLYIPEEKTGIRLENDILITRGQPINLMENIPIDPEEIEDLMNRI
jgi:Xaa-Pro aminopeptidase